ncbi:hypothetical protein BDQ12DRAFT_669677 [Crucibulum laeve]|uniref:Uncharacterized protein n=1 Tax=Crucibulum laeve TaxID=68775 RepID=A0A5C3LLS2_9AGAR|nr:hypothetical protein BDQ12DRAFT_669677 [Crucibulum laeve]
METSSANCDYLEVKNTVVSSQNVYRIVTRNTASEDSADDDIDFVDEPTRERWKLVDKRPRRITRRNDNVMLYQGKEVVYGLKRMTEVFQPEIICNKRVANRREKVPTVFNQLRICGMTRTSILNTCLALQIFGARRLDAIYKRF